MKTDTRARRRALVLACATGGAVLALADIGALLLRLWSMSTIRGVGLLSAALIVLGWWLDARWEAEE